MNRLFSTLLLLATALNMAAVPAKRVTRTITLSNGQSVTVTLRGDEHCKYFQAADGRRFRSLDDNRFQLISDADFARMTAHADERRGRIESLRQTRSANARRKIIAPAKEGQFEGSRKGLVILVNFSDVKLKPTSSLSFYDAMMNKPGFSQNGHIGSVNDYFKAQSYGKFDLTFDIVGPVTVSNTMAYYGQNDRNGEDMYAATMVSEACKQAAPYVNFKDYDWDGDGAVDQVYVIYAGYGESNNASPSTIWPHEWTLTEAMHFGDGDGPLKLGGVTIDTYACSNELDGTYGSVNAGIGNVCHEFSHCMGLPDLYDTQYDNFGMNAWSVMDYGCYNAGSCIPAAYTAYERMYCGWLNPIELTEGCVVEGMKPITAPDGQAYIIYNSKTQKEYYLLQNIQQESWNKAADGHGMLIIHVDYNAAVWQNNTVNSTPGHERCTIFHADNNSYITAAGLAGDPYPGRKNNTSLTDTSTPAATLFNANADGKKYMGRPITDIAEQNGLISFVFDGGGRPAPEPEGLYTPAAQSAPHAESIYDLQGKPVAPWKKESKGLYVSGQKIVLKR